MTTITASAAAAPTPAPPVGPPLADTWHSGLVDATVDVAIVFIFLGMLMCIYRLLRGPHLVDRALAVDTMSIELIGLVILLTIQSGTAWFVDGVMVLSLIGFAGTVAMAQYIARPNLAHRQPSAANETDAVRG